MTSQLHRRFVVAAIAMFCLPLWAATGASAVGDSKADYPGSAPAPKIGDTPADFAKPVAPAPKAGDTPVDHPGASRAPQYVAAPTIEVIRPETTIVRDVNEELPIALSGAALLLALSGLGIVVVRTRVATQASRSN